MDQQVPGQQDLIVRPCLKKTNNKNQMPSNSSQSAGCRQRQAERMAWPVSSYPIGGIFSSTHRLQHGFIQTQLQTSLVKHLPFIGVPCNQPVDFHRFALPYSVASSLSLEEKRKANGCCNGTQDCVLPKYVCWKADPNVRGLRR